MTLRGATYRLVFSNRAARIAEDVYADEFGKDVNYMEILREISRFKHRALLAVVYGAMIAGGATMPYQEFEDSFTYDSLDWLREAIMKSVTDALPEDDGKNPEARTATNGRGPG